MRITTAPFKPYRRSGFTIVESVVAIIIISLIAALIIPEIQHARTNPRRTACQINLRNVGQAVQAYATTYRGVLPPLTGRVEMKTSQTTTGRPILHAPWTVHLLPYLEQQALYDRLLIGRFHKSIDLAGIDIESFNCLDDSKPDDGGNLSYVANAGMIAVDQWNAVDDRDHSAETYDFGFNGFSSPATDLDRNVAYSTGVFWRHCSSSSSDQESRPLSFDFISKHDGTSQTVLLSENRDTRPRDSVANTGGWYSDVTADIAFGIPIDGRRVESRFEVALGDQPGGVGTAGDETTALWLGKQSISSKGGINSPQGKGRPRPSSNHIGIVNMAFADGSCKVISEKISLEVYARLLSPAGNRHGQELLDASDF